ncbi:conserved hypothetical protein [Dehalogenimonas lykanthroporepellens BL-DC-9]|nr:conserved hypothetical protein [Dehalogenimonas lykanthroporepellens BL-DC-9]
MREFGETDKKKKSKRIQLAENPAGLSETALAELRSTVADSLKDGYLPCGLAWAIADKAGVPRIAVGSIADRMGVRITECLLGCFKVDKTPFIDTPLEPLNEAVVKAIDEMKVADRLTCSEVCELARKHKVKPLTIADKISANGWKVHSCQLGCF